MLIDRQSPSGIEPSRHDELTAQLRADFPELAAPVVAREVVRAAAAVEFVGLGSASDQLAMCAAVARQQLQLLTGRHGELARLDRGRQPRRKAFDSPEGN